MTTATHPPALAGPAHTARLGLVRTRLEMIGLLRTKDAVIFTLALPVMLLVLFGAIFSDTLDGTTVTVGQWFTPGIIAASVLSAGFVNLATSLAIERHDGTLRRLALTPLPAASYLIGKILMTFLLAAGMTMTLLVVGVVAFDVDLPTGADDLATFGWVFLLGVTAAAVLGIALSSLPSSSKSAAVVFTPPFLFLQFISGVFIEFNSIPPWMRTLSGIFPLRWLAAGMRAVFLPDQFETAAEPGGSYQLAVGAAVLTTWVLVGFAVAVRTFNFGRER
ncbi:MAG: ABC transporter permease [Actinomycetia bacterium]|nr:ABC transporter permease [Actinomycetes bacterium]MCP4088102.1 ABC transporter permease [Actinomycetes bacterium]